MSEEIKQEQQGKQKQRIDGVTIQRSRANSYLFCFEDAEEGHMQIRLHFTKTELFLLQQLFEQKPISDEYLLEQAHPGWSYWTTPKNLEKNIERLRNKLKDTGIPLVIGRIVDYGYILLPQKKPTSSPL